MKFLNILINQFFLALIRFFTLFSSLPSQLVFSGKGSTQQLCEHVVRMGYKNILLITDKPLVDLGIADAVVAGVTGAGGAVHIYDGVLPDPTTDMVDAGVAAYQQHGCDSIVALGGGSSIDTAKGVSAALLNGDIRELMGAFKAKQGSVPLFAIPTTAGTGSEVTAAAVISNPETHEKGLMFDGAIMPKAIAIDAQLMGGMPPAVTAATGMDALTHAIETYVSRWSTPSVREYSGSAVQLIFTHLRTAYTTGDDLHAREAMAIAAYYAGVSLNVAQIGNVHALAHQLGARYGIPHGLANAVVLPQVLQRSHGPMSAGLAELAALVGIGDESDGDSVRALKFIDEVKALNEFLNIPTSFEQIQPEDIASIAADANKEGRAYPVPELYVPEDFENILKAISV